MEIGLLDVDSHNFPNLPLMKISAYHKAKGDSVEMLNPFKHYDIVYSSKVFGDEYSDDYEYCINADVVIEGGTGRAIHIKDGKEVYCEEQDKALPDEIEHIYPDYSLYPEYKDTALGFLTRGCPNNCPFCIVSKKEGRVSHKVADLSEFWRGQKHIDIMDANILACKDREDLLQQLIDSKAKVNFKQGLDARFITEGTAELLAKINIKYIHFAFDLMKNEKAIIKGLEIWAEHSPITRREQTIYILTNYNTTFDEDLYRVRAVRRLGYNPDVRIYRKNTAPQILKDMQRWANNRFIYNACDFWDYEARGKTMREWYKDGDNETHNNDADNTRSDNCGFGG